MRHNGPKQMRYRYWIMTHISSYYETPCFYRDIGSEPLTPRTGNRFYIGLSIENRSSSNINPKPAMIETQKWTAVFFCYHGQG